MSEGSIARTQDQRIQVDLNDPLADLDQAFRLAQMLAQSSMVPRALQGSPQNCLVTMLLGKELGLSWIQAIRGIYVLPSGQPGLRGALLLARIRAAGHRYEFIETDESCEFVITRKDEEFKIRHTGKFTVEDAKGAGLVHEKDGKLIARSNSGQPLPWETYRKDMLQWRAVARGASRGCPEIIFGFDLAGIGDSGESGTVVTAEVAQPAPPVVPSDKLRELDRRMQPVEADEAVPVPEPEETSQDRASDPGFADYDITVEDPPEDLPEPSDTGQLPLQPPGLAELHELLRRCGYPGAKQRQVCSILVHREIADMSDLTPGELYIAHDAITRIASGHASLAARRQALERHLEAEEMEL